jgi:fructosamine-3-kinase
MLPNALQQRLRPHLPGPPEAFEPVGGGCIANGGRLDAGGRSFFLKRGNAEVARTFPPEAAGLRALREAAEHTGAALRVPDVHAAEGPSGDAPGFLLMDWVEPGGTPGRAFWEAFGHALAVLHGHTSAEAERAGADGRYGFDRDNFIGRLPQENGWMGTWPAFFRERRLLPQVERARENDRWRAKWDAPWEALLDWLPALLPEAPPASILHGDLWGGNVLAAEDGPAAIIDPATYYGHREADLAMTELFGGFRAPFHEAYRAARPLEDRYEQRRDVYNLYHLVNHLNHFGGGYAGPVERALSRSVEG